MTEVVIVSAARTPIGAFGGSLSSLRADELGTVVIKEALRRADIQPDKIPGVCEVVMGQVLAAGQGQNPARQAALRAGLPYTVPATTVNMMCGSGIRAVVDGYLSIRNDDAQLAVCGGQESMSQTPHVVNMRKGLKVGNTSLCDTILSDGLTDAFYDIHMGETVERIADKEGITREQQDELALESQHRVAKAQEGGYFDNEIVPVPVESSEGKKLISIDEHPRKNLKMEDLQKLKPAFRKMEKVQWKMSDVDLFEINEAYACQAIAVMKQLGLSPTKVNINGGGVALGHPLGSSGARIIATLIYALKRTRGKRGVAAICIGGGMGIAICIEIC